jgi:hypothetical protein
MHRFLIYSLLTLFTGLYYAASAQVTDWPTVSSSNTTARIKQVEITDRETIIIQWTLCLGQHWDSFKLN